LLTHHHLPTRLFFNFFFIKHFSIPIVLDFESSEQRESSLPPRPRPWLRPPWLLLRVSSQFLQRCGDAWREKSLTTSGPFESFLS